jgi:hypothetical protein
MLLCFNGSNTGGNTAVPRQRELEWQWDKLRLFYERLVSEDEGGSVGGEEDLGEVGHQLEGEALWGLHRRLVEDHHNNTVVIITADDIMLSCLID